jgi:serine/threonine protein kinase
MVTTGAIDVKLPPAPPFLRSIHHRVSEQIRVYLEVSHPAVRDCIRFAIASSPAGVTQTHFLARGGTALVFRASGHRSADLALKVPRYRGRLPSDYSDAELPLRREAEALSFVQVDAIPRLVWRSPDGRCFLRELVEGIPVSVIAKRGDLPLTDRARLVVALLATAQEVFPRVHTSPSGFFVLRDFKPRNLIRETATGRLRLIDLGSVRREGNDSGTKGAVARLGTRKWRFWAPEQLFGAESVDRRADYFALASTAYYLLHAETPYSNTCDDADAAMRAYESEHVVATARLRTTGAAARLPRTVVEFLVASLSPAVSQRPIDFGVLNA